jgi:methyl-accepting chemotaxis protein PixJ
MSIQQQTVDSEQSMAKVSRSRGWMQRWQRLSLRTKVIVFSIAVSTLPALAIGAIEFWQDQQTLQAQLVADQETSTLLLADGIGRFLAERQGDLRLLAAKSILSDPQLATATPLRQKQAVFNQFIEVYGVYDQVAFADLSGKVLVEVGVSGGENLANEDYFKEVVQTRKPVIATPRRAKVTDLYSVFIAAPVFEINTDKLIGVVMARVPVGKIEEVFINNNPALEKGDHLFIDQRGLIFGAERQQELGLNATKAFVGFNALAGQDQLKTATLTSTIDRRSEIVTYTPLRQVQGGVTVPWKIALVQSGQVLQETQLRWLLSGIGFTSLSALVAGAIAALLARSLITPILEAAIAASAAVQDNERTMQQIQTRSLQQVEQVNGTLERVEQLAHAAHLIVTQTQQTEGASHALYSDAESGKALLDQILQDFSALRKSLTLTTQEAQQLGESSQHLSSLIDSIRHMAKQTNLAAMNTMIGANQVQMGTHPKAEKVAVVGQLTAELATLTETLDQVANQVQQETRQVLQGVDQGLTGVEDGIHRIEKTQHRVDQLLALSAQIDQSLQAIASATETQVQQSTALATSVKALDQAAVLTASEAQQITQSLRDAIATLHQFRHQINPA